MPIMPIARFTACAALLLICTASTGRVAALDAALVKDIAAVAANPDSPERLRAVLALGELSETTPEAAAALLSACKDANPAIRAAALQTLATTAPAAAGAPATELLKDPEAVVRATACAALATAFSAQPGAAGKFGGELPFADRDEQVRVAALRAEAALKSAGAARIAGLYLGETSEAGRAQILRTLAAYGFDAAAPLLDQALSTSSPAVALAALEVLSGKSAAELSPFKTKLEALAHKSAPWTLRAAAALPLAAADPAAGLNLAAEFMKTDNQYLREAGTQILARHGDAASAQILAGLWSDVFTVRRSASTALLALMERKVLTREALEALAATALKDADANRQGEALWIFGSLKSPAAFPAALDFIATTPAPDTPEAARAALTLWALAQAGHADGAPAAVKIFLAEKAAPECRLQALGALRALKYAPAAEALIKALEAKVKVEGEEMWKLLGRLREEAFLTVFEIAGAQQATPLLGVILSPRPPEEDSNIALVCRWYVANNIQSVHGDLGLLKDNKAFTPYAQKLLNWAHARLGGADAPFPEPPDHSNSGLFLSRTD